MTIPPALFYAALATALLLIFWLAILTFFLFRLSNHYRKITEGVSTGDLKSVWERHLEKVEEMAKNVSNLDLCVNALKQDGLNHLQKTALIRFNPFSDTGGDQSFALALLNNPGDGIVVSSLYTREGVRVYAKPVRNGKEDGYTFSKEEEEAVKKALAGTH